jgi:hypothetical protein
MHNDHNELFRAWHSFLSSACGRDTQDNFNGDAAKRLACAHVCVCVELPSHRLRCAFSVVTPRNSSHRYHETQKQKKQHKNEGWQSSHPLSPSPQSCVPQ